MSTAFIHLLYHGFLMFNNKCLGELVYGPTSPAIAMASALVTFLFDFLGGRTGHKRLESAHAAGTSSPDTASADEEKNNHHHHAPAAFDAGCSHAEAVFRQEQDWQVLLLEAGILFHSIMIGVTLGAGSGPGWTTLLIVIVFHQFFEAAALGSRIALLYWISRMRALLMGTAFILITPIGVAIGIGVRKSFAQNGKASLLAIGILNSVSAGILLYTAFRLLSGDFTEGPLRRGKWSAVVASLVAMFVGLISMSILGKWA
jgi:zinc transporter 1/2/3